MLFVVRHALAEDKLQFRKKNKNDDLRPLTTKGKKDFLKTSKIIRKLCPNVEVLFSSPLIRALETAEILEKRYKKKKQIIEELRPDKNYQDLLLKLKKYETAMIVGHEPHLSGFVGYLIKSKNNSVVLKKGALVILDVQKYSGKAQLLGLFQPKHLRK